MDHVLVEDNGKSEDHSISTKLSSSSQDTSLTQNTTKLLSDTSLESECPRNEKIGLPREPSFQNNIMVEANKNLEENDDSDDEPLSSKSHDSKVKSDENDNLTSDVPKDPKETEKLLKEFEEELRNIMADESDKRSDTVENDYPDSDDEPLSSKSHHSQEENSFNDDTMGSKVSKKPKGNKKLVKELEEELQTIHSENQRFARESTIDLPYHKPKISSLSDFLNRKSISKSMPTTPKDVLVCNDSQAKNVDFKTPQLTKLKKQLLKTDSVKSTTPKLSNQSDFVDLDCSEIPSGVTNLMSRFIKHNQKRAEGSPQEIKMHLVCKDTDKDGHEDLKAKEITVKVMSDINETSLNSQNFSNFKESLLSTIVRKKLERQATVNATCDLDNEEGFEDENSDSEDAESDLESNNSELEDVFQRDQTCADSDHPKGHSNNISKSNMEDNYNVLESQVAEADASNTCANIDSQHLFLEDSTDLPVESVKVGPDEEMDTSFELIGSLVPAHQPGGGLKNGGYELSDDEACTQGTSNKINTIFGKKSFEYDSENESPVRHISKGPFGFNKEEGTDTQNLHELLPLCSGKFASPVGNTLAVRSASVTDFSESPISSKTNIFQKSLEVTDSQNFNELLPLCTGKFASPTGNTPSESQISSKTKTIFQTNLETSDSQNYNELLDLCSGKFSSTINPENVFKERSLQKSLAGDPLPELLSNSEICSNTNAEPNLSDDEDDVIQSTWKKVARRSVKLHFDSDDECEPESKEKEEKENNELEDDEEEELEEAEEDELEKGEEEELGEAEEELEEAEEVESQTQELVAGNVETESHRATKVDDFFDQEAELSGSDVGSDDELEDDEEEQIFDDAVPSDEEMSQEELRNQIGKVHLKRLLDDDKREVRFFQEVYLEDGDLHADGNGRERKFRWLNVDYDNDNPENNEENSGDEVEQNALENEKWRVQRFEREKWLQEQETIRDESWTGFKLVKRNKVTSIGTPTLNFSPNILPGIVDQPKSFLAKNKDFCSRLAEKIQKLETEHVGRRSTKNFVFMSKSPVKPTKRTGEPVHVSADKIRKLNAPKVKDHPKKSIFDFI